MTKIKGGGIPLDVIIITSEVDHVIAESFKFYLSFMDTESFGGRGQLGPELIMTDDSAAEYAAFSKVFPRSHHLLCIFHFLQACYRWLMKHIRLSARKVIYFAIQTLVYSKLEEEFEHHYNQLIVDLSPESELVEEAVPEEHSKFVEDVVPEENVKHQISAGKFPLNSSETATTKKYIETAYKK